ncbi:MAG TPA: 2-aminoethylphosphonate ABC transporter permease subunit [Bauldia sp.]|nr:2-aminoethylphosphonate ABC transporter permease subunit [Bauldia sp.]
MADAAAPARPVAARIPAGLWVVPPAAVLAIIFFYPLALIARQGIVGDDGIPSLAHAGHVFGTAAFHAALLHTVEIAGAATIGCLILGFIFALLLSFVPFVGSQIIARLIETYVALPTFLVALAFTFIYGSAGLLNGGLMGLFGLQRPPVDFIYSPWGVILAEVTVYTPFVMRPLLAAFSLIDRAQLEVASSLGGRPQQIVREIIVPAALPALLAGGSLCLLLTVNEFGIVLFIGAKGVITLPLMVYDKAIQEFDYTTACVIAIVNVVLSLALYTLYRVLVLRFGGRRAGLV